VARLSSLFCLFVFCAVALTGSAQAGLLSGVLPGLVSPSDTPQTCDTAASQPFKRWGDNAKYVLMPGGAFESGGPAWGLTGGAKIVRGNEPYYVRSRSDSYSLELPQGSTATTPPMCFAFGDWKLRFFAVGAPGQLRVKIRVKSLLGIVSLLEAGTVKSGSTWQPSPEMQLLLTNIGGLLATDSMSLQFAPMGAVPITIDDGYLDPWKST
jgi:hypothetical protein